ncbi:hypothetical protein TNCV_4332721 [Trichonephila clavipes]|nr:hypothetical protein TNCV_4332721 [Trichonephila clavipes]
MVWAGISLGESSGLHITWNSNLTTKRIMPKIPELVLCRTKYYQKCLELIRKTHSARSLPLLTVRDMEIALQEQWSGITQSLTDKPTASMPNKKQMSGSLNRSVAPYTI